MSDFNWQTEDDADWDDLIEPTPKVRSARRWVRYLLPTLLVALAVLAGSIYMRQRLEQVVDTEVTATETQVRASYDLIFEVSAERDIELFGTLLSGRDPEWSMTQQQMVANNGLLDRTMFRWHSTGPPEITNVTITPELNSAEITATIQYTQSTSSTPLTFELPSVLRRGQDRWLFSPPEADYWGDYDAIERPDFLITHPQRDAEIVEQLTLDLQALYVRLCAADPGLACADRGQRPLIFSLDAEALTDLRLQPAPHLAVDDSITVPTPSLVGLPTDDASYQALLHGYADQIFSLMIADSVGYTCCKKALFFRAMVDQQLQKIGVGSAVVSAETAATLLERGIALNHTQSVGWDINDLRAASAAQAAFVDSFVDFVLTTVPEFRPSDLQKAVVASDGDFDSWLNALSTVRGYRRSADNAWLLSDRSETTWRAYSRYLNGLLSQNQTRLNAPPPQPLPNASAVVACQTTSAPASAVIASYDLQTEQWEEIYTGNAGNLPPEVQLRASSLPAHDGVWIQPLERRYEVGGWDDRPRLWRNNAVTTVDIDPIFYWMQHGSAENLLTVYQVLPQAELGSEGVYTQLNLETCSAESCELQPLRGNPDPSTEGSYILYKGNTSTTRMTVYDQNDTLVLDLPEFQPTTLEWLTDDAFIYNSDASIMRQSIDGERTIWLTVEDLAEALPAEQSDRYLIDHFVFDPADRNNLVILLSEISKGYLSTAVIYNIETGEVQLYQPVPAASLYSLADNGVYATFTLQSNDTGNWSRYQLLIHNSATQQNNFYAFGPSDRFTWVDEVNNWGMLLNNDVIRLVAPDFDYTKVIFPPYQNCNSLTWVHNTPTP